MPQGRTPSTRPVLLQPLQGTVTEDTETGDTTDNDGTNRINAVVPENSSVASSDSTDNGDTDVSEDTDIFFADDGDIQDDFVDTTEARPVDEPRTIYQCENKKQSIAFSFTAEDEIPITICPPFYTTVDPLPKVAPPAVIVWETSRRTPEAILLHPQNSTMSPLSCKDMIRSIEESTAGITGFERRSLFLHQLKRMSDKEITDFYIQLVEALEKANGYIATYSPALSYCTGAHNNSVLLGSDQQAKAAVFYLCPYLGKDKFPLKHALTVLQKALDDIKAKPSIQKDSGSPTRTAKHLLQRVLNKMNFKMELSGECIRFFYPLLPSFLPLLPFILLKLVSSS